MSTTSSIKRLCLDQVMREVHIPLDHLRCLLEYTGHQHPLHTILDQQVSHLRGHLVDIRLRKLLIIHVKSPHFHKTFTTLYDTTLPDQVARQPDPHPARPLATKKTALQTAMNPENAIEAQLHFGIIILKDGERYAFQETEKRHRRADSHDQREAARDLCPLAAEHRRIS